MKAFEKFEPMLKNIISEAKHDILTLLKDNNITSLNVNDYVNELGVMCYGFSGCNKNGYGVNLTIDSMELKDKDGKLILECDMVDEAEEPFDTYYISLEDNEYDGYGYFCPTDLVEIVYLLEEIIEEINDGEPIIKKGEWYDDVVEEY